MDIFLYNNDYKYAAEQMMLMLYPEERPVYPAAEGTGNRVSLTISRRATFTTASCRLVYGGRTARAAARIRSGLLQNEAECARLEQRILKLAFYRAALAAGHPKPEWGCLTGVRPAKMLSALIRRDGLSE